MIITSFLWVVYPLKNPSTVCLTYDNIDMAIAVATYLAASPFCLALLFQINSDPPVDGVGLSLCYGPLCFVVLFIHPVSVIAKLYTTLTFPFKELFQGLY